ncbi:MAG: hypothetical protein AB1511_14395 [Deinococcota bacterium]
MRRHWPLIAVFLWALFTFGPLLSALFAAAVASANGCALDEGSIHPCVIAGWDAGRLLYSFGVLGWLELLTLPLGAAAGAAVLVVWLLWRGRRTWIRNRSG